MHIGLYLNNIAGFPLPEGGVLGCLHLAEQAERLGFASVWVADQLLSPAATGGVGEAEASGEALVLLSALAWRTRRVAIGVLGLAAPLRHPLVTAKMLATADRLAGGRLICGMTSEADQAAFAALGAGSHYAERDAVTDDYLRAIKEAWTNTGPSRYTGDYVRFSEVGAFPHPVRQPHIPIWISGAGPAALKRAVRLGSGFISSDEDPAALGRTTAELRRLAETDRRDPDEITVALATDVHLTATPAGAGRAPLTGSAEQVRADLEALAAGGVGHLIATVHGASGGLEARMEAISRLAALLPAATTAGAGGGA